MVRCTSRNAVIVKDDGRMIRYHHLCPSCGYEDNQEQLCSLVSGSTSQRFTYRCRKCGKDLGSFDFRRD